MPHNGHYRAFYIALRLSLIYCIVIINTYLMTTGPFISAYCNLVYVQLQTKINKRLLRNSAAFLLQTFYIWVHERI